METDEQLARLREAFQTADGTLASGFATKLRTSYNTYGDTILARVPEASMLSCILTDFSAARYN